MATTFTPLNSDFASQFAQLQADREKYDRNQQMAQAMMSQGYTPGSGWIGALAPLLGVFMGKRLQRQGDEKVSDLLKREFELQGKQAEAKRQQDLADEQRKFQLDLEKASKTAQAQEAAKAQYRERPDWQDPKWLETQLTLAQGKARIDAQNRPAPADPFATLKAARAAGAIDDNQFRLGMQQIAMGQQGGGNIPSGYQRTETGLAPIPGGPADPNRPQAPQPLTAEAKNKLALIDNAIANAKKYAERTITRDANGKVTDFKDIASNTNDTPALLTSAIQDMLYAKSGASAPVEEVRKAEGMYGPAGSVQIPLLGIPTGIPQEKDSTAGQKVLNLINDLERMRGEIGGTGNPAPAQSGQPTREEIMAEIARRRRGG